MDRKSFLLVLFVLLGLVFIFNSIQFLQRDIVKGIEMQCDFSILNGDPCYVDLSEVFSFEWDEVFEFEDSHSIEQISEAIGFECHCKAVDYERYRIVFIRSGKIVREEEYDLYPKHSFVLPPDDEDGIPNFRFESAYFRVTKRKANPQYTLELVESHVVN